MKEDENFVHRSANIQLSSSSQSVIKEFLNQYPSIDKHENKVTKRIDVNTFQPFVLQQEPSVPPINQQNDNNIIRIRNSLPIHQFKDKIMEAIDKNRIILVQGR